MGEALLALLERLVTSPVAQQAAWDVLKPLLANGQHIDHPTLMKATQLAEVTEREAKA